MLYVTVVPDGCAEYGSLAPDAPMSKRIVLAMAYDRFGNECRLEEVTEGWTPAGSLARWQDPCYAYAYAARDGSRGGRQYRTLEEARAHFDKVKA